MITHNRTNFRGRHESRLAYSAHVLWAWVQDPLVIAGFAFLIAWMIVG